MNNDDFASNIFTWVLEDHSMDNNNTLQPQLQQQDQSKQPEQFGLSDADLFQFLMGEESQQAAVADNQEYNGSGKDSTTLSQISSIEEEYTTKPTKQAKAAMASATSRLDFRPIHDHIPESQLKAMTSKERRQLRNKISARNFRNRRKEYIGTLEDELNQQKAENSQLKLEIKSIKAKMEKVRKENDKLRVDLALGGIVLPTPSPFLDSCAKIQQQQTSPFLFDSSAVNNSMALMPSNVLITSSSSSASSDESTLSSPPNLFNDFPDNWDFVLPQQQQQSQQDTYLSHAMVPNWNINQVLSKEISVSPLTNHQLLLQQYPLLAPALMSIVLTHTMTMSTDEILATAKLSPPAANVILGQFDKKHMNDPLTNKEAQAVWNILEPLTTMQDRNEKISAVAATAAANEKDEDNDKEEATTDGKGEKKSRMNQLSDAYFKAVLPFCPVTWFQHKVCRFLCEYAANNYQNEKQQEKIAATAAAQSQHKPMLCKHFQKAKRFITPCQ